MTPRALDGARVVPPTFRAFRLAQERIETMATVITAPCTTKRPSIDELRKARKLRTEFSNESPATFRLRIQDGRLDLGVLSREEGRAIARLATSLGLAVEHVATARIVHSFKDRGGSGYLIVEDDRDAEQVATAMIAAGVPVEDAEVD